MTSIFIPVHCRVFRFNWLEFGNTVAADIDLWVILRKDNSLVILLIIWVYLVLLVDVERFGSTELIYTVPVHDVQFDISLDVLRHFWFNNSLKVIVTDRGIVIKNCFSLNFEFTSFISRLLMRAQNDWTLVILLDVLVNGLESRQLSKNIIVPISLFVKWNIQRRFLILILRS